MSMTYSTLDNEELVQRFQSGDSRAFEEIYDRYWLKLYNTFNTKNPIGLLSYLSRVSYAYRSKYLLSASFWADGSSYFAQGKKWGYFPSVSAGWVVSEEKNLKNVKWISQLKLRGSYGATGNNRIVDFAYLDLLYASNYILNSGTGTVAIGETTSKEILSNPNITWERTYSTNLGLDLALFKNALTISLDAYQSKTDQLLLKSRSNCSIPRCYL